jgi:flagellar basal-body rod protein FlgB
MKTMFDGVDSLERAMTFHRERHSVLAGNVANIDTPGYRSIDLEEIPAEQAPGELARTDEMHLATSGTSLDGTRLAFDDSPNGPGMDGNTVELERELAKIDANRVRYGTTTELASRRLALLRYAAGDGS